MDDKSSIFIFFPLERDIYIHIQWTCLIYTLIIQESTSRILQSVQGCGNTKILITNQWEYLLIHVRDQHVTRYYSDRS